MKILRMQLLPHVLRALRQGAIKLCRGSDNGTGSSLGVSEAGRAGGGEGLVTALSRLLYGVLLVLRDMANNFQTEFSAVIRNV